MVSAPVEMLVIVPETLSISGHMTQVNEPWSQGLSLATLEAWLAMLGVASNDDVVQEETKARDLLGVGLDF